MKEIKKKGSFYIFGYHFCLNPNIEYSWFWKKKVGVRWPASAHTKSSPFKGQVAIKFQLPVIESWVYLLTEMWWLLTFLCIFCI
jgi:hypothetical protein